MKYYFAVDISWNRPSLTRVEVLSETEKTFCPGEVTKLIGDFGIYTRNARKSTYKLFDTQEDALAWLIKTFRVHIAQKEKELAEIRWRLQDLEKMTTQEPA